MYIATEDKTESLLQQAEYWLKNSKAMFPDLVEIPVAAVTAKSIDIMIANFDDLFDEWLITPGCARCRIGCQNIAAAIYTAIIGEVLAE